MRKSKPQKSKPKLSLKPIPAPVVLTPEAEQQKTKAVDPRAETSSAPRKSLKNILRVFFCPLRKLKTKNSALSLVKIITSLVCRCISMLGYICAIVMLLKGIFELIRDFSLDSAFTAVFCLLFAAVIWLLSRLIAATGLEIEETNNESLIFGIASFILAIIAIIISM